MATSPPDANQAQSGVVVIDKPAGWTSHQVIAKIRRLAGTRKVGHAGTLDPMATGVLIVGIEKATRLLGWLVLSEKAYEATIRLGIATITDDAEGEVTAGIGAAGLDEQDIEQAMAALRGQILQIPSAVSAIKINGVRSYTRVRGGEVVNLTPRPVQVLRFVAVARRAAEVRGLQVLDLDVQVECSTGTYVRALARDLGAALGVGGHLTRLRRTRVGTFDVEEAQTLEEAGEQGLAVMTLNSVVRRCFVTQTITEHQADWVRHGRRLPDLRLPAATSALLTKDGNFLALYRQEGADAVAKAVFA
jgi:tRNA pseudouridine55 synthase